MSYSQAVTEYSKLVCKLVENDNRSKYTHNPLSKHILDINGIYKNSTENTNRACTYVTSNVKSVVDETISSSAISVGKENVPLIVSLKQCGDRLLSNGITGCKLNAEESLQNEVSKIEDNFYKLEDFLKSSDAHIKEIKFLLKIIKKLKDEKQNGPGIDSRECFNELKPKNLSAGSLLSFSEVDVVSSSPIAK